MFESVQYSKQISSHVRKWITLVERSPRTDQSGKNSSICILNCKLPPLKSNYTKFSSVLATRSSPCQHVTLTHQ